MGRKAYSECDRRKFISMVASRASREDIMREIGLGKSAYYQWRKKLQACGSISPVKQTGRPNKLSDRAIRALVNQANKNPRASASTILGGTPLQICTKTARRYLHAAGVHCYQELRKPALNKSKARKRLEWARLNRNQSEQEWDNWVFSDECSVQLFGSGGRGSFGSRGVSV